MQQMCLRYTKWLDLSGLPRPPPPLIGLAGRTGQVGIAFGWVRLDAGEIRTGLGG